MEEINLMELFNYYLKKLPIIIITIVIAIILGVCYIEYIQVPMYHGTTTIILVQKSSGNEDDINITQNELNVNEKLVSTYSEIVKSRRVLNQVKKELKLKTTTDDLAEQIEVTAVTETSIIKVTVSDKNKKQAVKIANEVAKVFKSEITKIYNLENVSVIDEAIVEKAPYNVSIPKQMVIYILVGLVLSCGVIFVMYYFDNTIKSKKEIETNLGLPVLAEIPVAGKLKRKKRKSKRKKKISNDDIRAKDINNKVFDNVDKDITKEKEEETPTKKKATKTTKKATKTKEKKTTKEKDTEPAKTTKKKTTTRKRTTKKKEEGGK